MQGNAKAGWRGMLVLGVLLWVAGFVAMRCTMPPGVHREAVQITGPLGKPCLGVLYTPATAPKAMILVGHGVSCNTGVMATIAKAFAAQGYVAVAIDFWGHGRSHERFSWTDNPAQVLSWCAWAKDRYLGLPLAYLGHSMGGFAGGAAFAEQPAVNAFVAMGAIPQRFSSVKTLIAAGRFEELFTPEKIAAEAQGHADTLISPYSDHTGEAWDAFLIDGMVSWADKALGVAPSGPMSRRRLWLSVLAAALAGVGAMRLAQAAAAMVPAGPASPAPVAVERRWSVNPYRLTARLLRCVGSGAPPRAGTIWRAVLCGVVFGLVFIAPLSLVLTDDLFTSRLDHPKRLVGWGLTALLLLGPALLDAWALERVALTGQGRRFAVAALTRFVPLLLLGGAMYLAGPGIAFGGMLVIILAMVSLLLSHVHALCTRASGDYRAGAVAACILFAWVVSFWFPLNW